MLQWITVMGLAAEKISPLHAEVTRLNENWKQLVPETLPGKCFQEKVQKELLKLYTEDWRHMIDRQHRTPQEQTTWDSQFNVVWDIVKPQIRVTKAILMEDSSGSYTVEVQISQAIGNVSGSYLSPRRHGETINFAPEAFCFNAGVQVYETLYKILGLATEETQEIVPSE